MKEQIKFFILKFIVLNTVNLIAFAAAILIDTLSGFFFTADNASAQTALVCASSFIIFLAYLFFSGTNMKESSIPPALFVIRESAAYMIFMIVPTVSALIHGASSIGQTPLMRFYLPNLIGTHLSGMPIVGFFIQCVIFTAVIAASHAINLKKTSNSRADEARKRAEDAAYAEKLARQHEQEES